MSRTWAGSIIAKVCNEHRNSDLRADNPEIIRALNEAHEKDLKLISALEQELDGVASDYGRALDQIP